MTATDVPSGNSSSRSQLKVENAAGTKQPLQPDIIGNAKTAQEIRQEIEADETPSLSGTGGFDPGVLEEAERRAALVSAPGRNVRVAAIARVVQAERDAQKSKVDNSVTAKESKGVDDPTNSEPKTEAGFHNKYDNIPVPDRIAPTGTTTANSAGNEDTANGSASAGKRDTIRVNSNATSTDENPEDVSSISSVSTKNNAPLRLNNLQDVQKYFDDLGYEATIGTHYVWPKIKRDGLQNPLKSASGKYFQKTLNENDGSYAYDTDPTVIKERAGGILPNLYNFQNDMTWAAWTPEIHEKDGVFVPMGNRTLTGRRKSVVAMKISFSDDPNNPGQKLMNIGVRNWDAASRTKKAEILKRMLDLYEYQGIDNVEIAAKSNLDMARRLNEAAIARGMTTSMTEYDKSGRAQGLSRCYRVRRLIKQSGPKI